MWALVLKNNVFLIPLFCSKIAITHESWFVCENYDYIVHFLRINNTVMYNLQKYARVDPIRCMI